MKRLSNISYPIEIDPLTGGLKMSYGSDVRRDNINSLITTMKKERIMNPVYGSELYLFDVINNLAIVNDKVKTKILAYVPDIDCEVTSVIDEQNAGLLITIEWVFFENEQAVQEPISFNLSF